MKVLQINILYIAVLFSFLSCNGYKLKKELEQTAKEWNYVLPMPSDNDSLNLLFIQAEKSWYMFDTHKSDSLCDVMLSIDSTFHQALSFKAWQPLNLEYLNKAMEFAKNDTTIHRTVLEADYAFWVNGDSITAMKKFREVFDKYPDSHTASWCLGQSYLWAGRLDQAIEQYKKCLEISPVFPRANQMMGWVYYWKNDNEKSIENFKISFDQGNNNEWDYRYAGKALEKLGKPEEAAEYFRLADEAAMRENNKEVTN